MWRHLLLTRRALPVSTSPWMISGSGFCALRFRRASQHTTAAPESSPPPPTSQEVREAFSIFQMPVTSSFDQLRARYIQLAKEVHPDVARGSASATPSTSSAQKPSMQQHASMSSINDAFNILRRAHKAGVLSSAARSSTSWSGTTNGANRTAGRGEHPRGGDDDYPYPYHPMWEQGVPPELYEAMWQHMHAHGSQPFGSAEFRGGAFYHEFGGEDHLTPPPGYVYDEFVEDEDGGMPTGSGSPSFPHRRHRHSQSNSRSAGRPTKGHSPSTERLDGASTQRKKEGTAEKQPSQQGETHKQQQASEWSDADLTALQNMYQDGKSFEFIGNALGKSTESVVGAFNTWQQSADRNRNHHRQHHQQRGNRRHHNHPGQQRFRGGRGAPFHPGADEPLWYGMSGGVVVDEEGNVVDVDDLFNDLSGSESEHYIDEHDVGENPRPWNRNSHYMHRPSKGGVNKGHHRRSHPPHKKNQQNGNHNDHGRERNRNRSNRRDPAPEYHR